MSAIPYPPPYIDPYLRWQAGCQKIKQEMEQEKIAFENQRSCHSCKVVASYVSAAAFATMSAIYLLTLDPPDDDNGKSVLKASLVLSGSALAMGSCVFAWLLSSFPPNRPDEKFRYRLVEPEFAAQQKIRLKELSDPAECYYQLNDLCDAGIITWEIKARISAFSEKSITCQRKIKKVDGYDKKVREETKLLLYQSVSLEGQRVRILREWCEYRDSIINQIPNPLEYEVESV